MSTATFFTGSAPTPTSSSSAKRNPAAAFAVARKAPLAAPAPRVATLAGAAYPWITASMLAGMSPRARRLLRADY